MKLTIIIGRLGAILFMVGLALAVAASFPPGRIGQTSGEEQLHLKSFEIFSSAPISSQEELFVSVRANNSVRVYLLNVSESYFMSWASSWVSERFPNLEGYEAWVALRNITVFDAFLENNPNMLLWSSNLSNVVSKNIYFEKATNCTVVVTAPSEPVYLLYELTTRVYLVPKGSSFKAQLIMISSIVLMIPWTLTKFKELLKLRR
jgi:hypothetical protein